MDAQDRLDQYRSLGPRSQFRQVTVSVSADAARVYVSVDQVWGKDGATPDERINVHFASFARRTEEAAEMSQIALYVGRFVANMDANDWPVIRS